MAVQDERLLELWNRRKQAGWQLRQHYHQRWLDNWQWYRNEKNTQRVKGQQWRSNVQVPDAFRIIETMVPQHILNMYRTNRWFSVEAPSVAGDTYQRVVKNLLLQGWRKANGYSKAVHAVKYGNVLGHVVPKVTWEQKLGERLVTDIDTKFDSDGNVIDVGFVERTNVVVEHNGPQIHLPDLLKLYQDPTGEEKWWIEIIPTSLDALKEANRQFGGALYKNLDKIEARGALGLGRASGVHPSTRDSMTATGQSTLDIYDIEDLASQIEGIPEYFRLDPDNITLWQCWGYVPRSVRDYSRHEDPTQWRMVVVANNDVIIRDEPAPTWNRRPPYINCPAVPIPNQVYGDSVLSYVGPLIDLRSFIENTRRDEVLLNMYGTYAIDGRFEITGQDMFKMPGGAMRLMPKGGLFDGTIRDAIIPIQRSPVMPEAYNESAWKERQILDTSGATEMFQGKNFSGRPTATEINTIANLGMGRSNLSVFWWDENFNKPILDAFFHYYQSKLKTPQVIELAGSPNLRGEIDFSDLQYDVDIHVETGKFGSLDAESIQAMNQFIAMFSQIPEAAIGIRWKKLASDALFRLGFEDRYEREDEEVEAIQQRQEQQQLLEAALGGSSQAGAGQAQ